MSQSSLDLQAAFGLPRALRNGAAALALFALASCGGGGGGGSTPPAGPVATSLVALPDATPLFGGTFTLKPTYSGGTGAITDSDLVNGLTCPATTVATPAITANWTNARTYTLTVTGSAGAPATTTVVVTPQTVAVGAVGLTTPIAVNGTRTFTVANVTGGFLGTVTWSATAGTNAAAGTMVAATGAWTAPATAGTVVIKATSDDDSTKSASATITVAAAGTATLAASTQTPAYGATNLTITPTFTNPSAVVGTTLGASDISASPVSGTPIPVETSGITAPKTYYLRTTNSVNVTTDASVTVTPQTVAVGAVSPATPNVSLSGTQTFTAIVTGGFLGTKTWSVAVGGALGTNANAGSIDPVSGDWTAPATAGTVTIKATSIDDPTKSASTLAAVVAGPSITSFTATQSTFTTGATGARLNFSFANGTGVITAAGVTSPTFPSSTTSWTVTPTPTASTTYTLTVTNGANVHVSQTAAVMVGTLSVLGGTPSGLGNIDGGTILSANPIKARFWEPNGVLVDQTTGTVYISDYDNNTIRKITSAGVVSTAFGQVGAHGSQDANGTSATFFGPSGMVMDASGNIYVADAWNFLIRRINTAGDVTTLAGTATVPGSADAVGSGGDSENHSQFHFAWNGSGSTPANIPVGLALLGNNLYVADQLNHVIRMVDVTTGTVTTPYGTVGVPGLDNTTGALKFDYPTGLAIIGTTLYVADFGNDVIRAINTTNGVTTTLASGFTSPTGLTTDSTLLYEVDYEGCQINTITTGGVVDTIAGDGTDGTGNNADGTLAKFRFPTSVGVYTGSSAYPTGTLFIADFGNNTVRQIAPGGNRAVTTLAGVDGNPGYSNTAPTQFNNPTGFAWDAAHGIAYVADTSNRAVRSIVLSSGAVSTVAKSSVLGVAATFSPTALAVGSDGTLYILDGQNGVVDTLAYLGSSLAALTGATGFVNAQGIAVDSGATPNVYVADTDNAQVVKVAAGVKTILGSGYTAPIGIAVDPVSGTALLVADSGNRIVYTQPVIGGAPTVLAGSGSIGSTDAAGALASFGSLEGLAVDAAGTVYVADSYNNTLRMITPAGVVSTIGGVAGTMVNIAAGPGVALPASFATPASIAVAPTFTVGGVNQMLIAVPDAILTVGF